MLPQLDGLEVLRRIRHTSAVPVLMLTARGEETDRVVGLEVGADDYLTKPFSMRELIARVHALLRRVDQIQKMLQADRAEDDTSIESGGLRLDPIALSRHPRRRTDRSEPHRVRSTASAAAQSGPRLQSRLSARYRVGRDVCGRRSIGGQRHAASAEEAAARSAIASKRCGAWGIGYEGADEG